MQYLNIAKVRDKTQALDERLQTLNKELAEISKETFQSLNKEAILRQK